MDNIKSKINEKDYGKFLASEYNFNKLMSEKISKQEKAEQEERELRERDKKIQFKE